MNWLRIHCTYVGLLVFWSNVWIVEGGWQYVGCYQFTGLQTYLHQMQGLFGHSHCKSIAMGMNCSFVGIQDNGFCYINENSLVIDFATINHLKLETCSSESIHLLKSDERHSDDCLPDSPFECLPQYNTTLRVLQDLLKATPECTSTISLRGGYVDNCFGFRFGTASRHLQCKRIFRSVIAEYNIQHSNPPIFQSDPPKYLQNDLSMGGVIPFWQLLIREDTNEMLTPTIWNISNVYEATQKMCTGIVSFLCTAFKSQNKYNEPTMTNSDRKIFITSQITASIAASKPIDIESTQGSLSSLIRGKVGLVFGSKQPWIEGLLLQAGVTHIITATAYYIVSRVPEISVTSHSQIASISLAANWAPVDFIVSRSTVQHAGLGRFGEVLDANGDFKSMAQYHCLLKPGGILLLSIPIGMDMVVYNSHRQYGRQRLPKLLTGWEVLDIHGIADLDNKIFLDSAEINIFVLRKL